MPKSAAVRVNSKIINLCLSHIIYLNIFSNQNTRNHINLYYAKGVTKREVSVVFLFRTKQNIRP